MAHWYALPPGEHLRLTAAANTIKPADADSGSRKLLRQFRRPGGAFAASVNTIFSCLGGSDELPGYVAAQRVETPKIRNKGVHLFHLGGRSSHAVHLSPSSRANSGTTSWFAPSSM